MSRLLTTGILQQQYNLSIKRGLLLCYEMDEASGTIVYDVKGNYNGTSSGCLVNQSGKINKCYYYDENDDYIEFPVLGIFDCTKNFSVSTWIYCSSLPGGAPDKTTDMIFSPRGEFNIGINIQSFNTYTMLTDNTYLKFFWYYNSVTKGYIQYATGTTLLNAWNHIVCICDVANSLLRMYVNNSSVGTVSTGTPAAQTDKNTIGCQYYSSTPNNEFHGYIDQTAIWNRVLTTMEIAKLYNSGNGFAYTNWK
jgi:hypothetical protein